MSRVSRLAAAAVGAFIVANVLSPIGHGSEDEWLPGIALPAPQFHLQAVAVGTAIYAGLGAPGAPRFDRLDPVDGGHTPLALPQRPAQSAVGSLTASSGFLYYIGGESSAVGSVVDWVDRYDIEGDHWDQMAPLLIATESAAVVAYEDKLFVFGGYFDPAAPGMALDQVQIYDIPSNHWVVSPRRMPRRRMGHVAGIVNGKIYVFGGIGQGGPTTVLDTVDVYDPEDDSWSTVLTRAPNPRRNARLVELGSRLAIISGSAADGSFTPLVEVYEPENDAWSTLPPLNLARNIFAAVRVNQRIYVLGGEGGAPVRPLADVEYLDVSHDFDSDGDGDGVPDGVDNCPATPPTFPVDLNGCIAYPAVSISAPASIAENGGHLLVEVRLSTAFPTPLSIWVRALSRPVVDTATPGVDFQALSQTITIPAGQLSAFVTSTVLPDRRIERTETFTIDATPFFSASAVSTSVSITDLNNYPVLLVHGFNSTGGEDTFDQLRPLLEAQGRTVCYAGDRGDQFCSTGDYDTENMVIENESTVFLGRPTDDLVAALARDVERLLAVDETEDELGNAVTQVDIVAHSMGGVVARLVMADASNSIRRLVTLASPHYGARAILGDKTNEVFTASQVAQRRDLTPGSRFLTYLEAEWSEALDARVLTIGGLRDIVVSAESAVIWRDGLTRAFVDRDHSNSLPQWRGIAQITSLDDPVFQRLAAFLAPFAPTVADCAIDSCSPNPPPTAPGTTVIRFLAPSPEALTAGVTLRFVDEESGAVNSVLCEAPDVVNIMPVGSCIQNPDTRAIAIRLNPGSYEFEFSAGLEPPRVTRVPLRLAVVAGHTAFASAVLQQVRGAVLPPRTLPKTRWTR